MMLRRPFVVIAIGLPGLAFACGTAFDDRPPSGDAGADAAPIVRDGSADATVDGDDAAIADAATGDDGDASDASDSSDAANDAGTLLRAGTIVVAQSTSSGLYYKSASVTFAQATAIAPSRCKVTTVSPGCTFADCGVTYDAGAPVDAGAVAVSGGTVTLTGFPMGLILTPDSSNTYAVSSPSDFTSSTFTDWFASTNSVMISGSGTSTTVAGFNGTIIVPSAVKVTQPSLTGGSTSFPRDQDQKYVWSGGDVTGETVEIAVAAYTDTTQAIASCAFDGTLGTGTIPAAALMMLPEVTGSPYRGALSIETYTTQVITAADQSGIRPDVPWRISAALEGISVSATFTTTD